MAKIAVKKGRKEYIKELDREVRVVKQAQFYIQDISKDFHCTDGIINKSDLAGKKTAKTSKGKDYCIFDSSFIDDYRRMKRLAQIIPLKDIGSIITGTGIGPDSIVIDSGTGSGAVSIFIARYAKEVISYDIVEEHTELAKENAKILGINNVKYKKGDIKKKIKEKDADVFILDIPDPWLAVDTVEKALKQGGFLAVYCPTIPQTADFVNAVKDNDKFIHIKTIEIIERKWEIDGRKVRPKGQEIGHSAFLTFVRKIK